MARRIIIPGTRDVELGFRVPSSAVAVRRVWLRGVGILAVMCGAAVPGVRVVGVVREGGGGARDGGFDVEHGVVGA